MHSTICSSLRRIWRTNTWNDYRAGFIASERELQACVYYHLREELAATSAGHARIFVEPTIKGVPGSPKLFRRPDLIVAAPSDDVSTSFQVVAFIELKLHRGSYIVYESELDRIERLGAHTSITVENQRYERNAHNLTLNIDEKTQFFLGFVGKSDADALDPAAVRKGHGGFAARSPGLAKRTTLLYGRVHSDGATLFSDETLS